jgi:hypothetical protein
MKTLAISSAVAASMLVSPAAVAQDAPDFSTHNPLVVIFGGIFGAAPPANTRSPSSSEAVHAPKVMPQQSTERFAMEGNRDERGYVQMTVKGRNVLVDPRTRRIVEVLE